MIALSWFVVEVEVFADASMIMSCDSPTLILDKMFIINWLYDGNDAYSEMDCNPARIISGIK